MSSDKTEVTPKRPASDLPPLPRLESTYTQIIGRAIHAAKQRTGLTQRIRSATRELLAIVPHTRQQWRGLSTLGKVLTVVALLATGSGSTLLFLQLFGSGNVERLRAEARASLEAKDYVEAKRLLHLIAGSPEGLSAVDRSQLVAPVQAGLEQVQRELQKQTQDAAAAGRFDDALVALDSLDKAGLIPEWSAFARAEVLRSARRHSEALAAYARFLEMAPKHERADDALFWQAAEGRELGQTDVAKAALNRLLSEYPDTNFKTSARRWLAELGN
jgi:tetratricopeptide (TPR) repeat protein